MKEDFQSHHTPREAVSRAWNLRVGLGGGTEGAWARACQRERREGGSLLSKESILRNRLTPGRPQRQKRLQSRIESAGAGVFAPSFGSKPWEAPPRLLRTRPSLPGPASLDPAARKLLGSSKATRGSRRKDRPVQVGVSKFISPFLKRLGTSTMGQTTGPQGPPGPLQYNSHGQDKIPSQINRINYTHPAAQPLPRSPPPTPTPHKNVLNNKQAGWLAV